MSQFVADTLRYSFLDMAHTRKVQEVDPALQVHWNAKRRRFIVIDTAAPGGIEQSIVMVVQEPSGAFRPFDERTMTTLRRVRYRSPQAIERELADAEAARLRASEKQAEDFADGFASDLKWMGQQNTPSVAWRDRSAAREAIRKAAS